MRIAIDVRVLGRQRTGDETVFRALVMALAQNTGVDTYDLLIDTRPKEDMEALAIALGISQHAHIRLVSCGSGNRFLWNAWTAPWYCLRHAVSVYHTQYITPLWMPRKTKTVTHIHDVSFAALPEFIGWRDLLFLRILIPRSLRRAQGVIAVSEFTKEEIHRFYGIAFQKITVIPNALNEEFRDTDAYSAQQRANIRAHYALPTRYVFSLGTMQPRKNMPFLLRAFAMIAARVPDVHLVLSGGRGHHFDADIDRLIGQMPELAQRIHFTGYIAQQHLPAIYAEACAFAFPSLYEGFGVPLLEACAAGTPIVASDLPVFHEVARDCAVYADPRDLAAFAEALYTVIMYDDRTRTAYRHMAHARATRFAWGESAARLRALYHAVVNS